MCPIFANPSPGSPKFALSTSLGLEIRARGWRRKATQRACVRTATVGRREAYAKSVDEAHSQTIFEGWLSNVESDKGLFAAVRRGCSADPSEKIRLKLPPPPQTTPPAALDIREDVFGRSHCRVWCPGGHLGGPSLIRCGQTSFFLPRPPYLCPNPVAW